MRWMPMCLALCALSCATTSTSKTEDKAAAKTADAEAPKKSLFDRLGGKGAIEAVVDNFLGRVAGDERINAGFAVSDVPRVRQRLIELVCAASGGPCVYSGRDMTTVHVGMKTTNAQFDALVGHLVASLDTFKVPDAEKNDLLGLLGPMRSQIVEEP